MKVILSSKKYNFLIKWGVLVISLSFILSTIEQLFIENTSVNETSIRNNFFGDYSSKYHYLILFILGIFIGPLFEEAIFRGNFLRNKIFKSLSLFCLVLFVGFFYFESNFLVVGMLILYLVSIFSLRKKESEIKFKIALVLNALLFSLVHNDIEDYFYFSTFSYSIQRLGIAFILLWITLNYNLLCSFIFHSLWNTIFFSLVFLTLMFPNDLKHKAETKNLEVTWEAVGFLNNQKFESEDSLTYVYKTYLLKDVLNTSSFIVGEIDEKTRKKINKFEIEDKTSRYDIIIKFKDSSLYRNGNLYLESFLNILEEEKLIKLKNE